MQITELDRFHPIGYKLKFLTITQIPDTEIVSHNYIIGKNQNLSSTCIIMGSVIRESEEVEETSVEFICTCCMNENNTIFMETKFISKLPMEKTVEIKTFKVDELRFKERRRIVTGYGFDYIDLNEKIQEMIYRLIPYCKTNSHPSHWV